MLPVKLIIEGWTNWALDFFFDLKHKKEYDARMEICKKCDHNKHGICEICHCVLTAKTKSGGSACPEKKWDVIK